jgi:hypothetical protein
MRNLQMYFLKGAIIMNYVAVGKFVAGAIGTSICTHIAVKRARNEEIEKKLHEERVMLAYIKDREVELEMERMRNKLILEGKIKTIGA